MSYPATLVALSVELNENIYSCMQDFLAANPQWNREKLINASISLFLIQNHNDIKPEAYQDCSKTYIKMICNNYLDNAQN